MPSNFLIIENDDTLVIKYEEFLNGSLKIQHHIIDSFNSFEEQLFNNNYSHLIINSKVDQDWFSKYKELIKLPTLLISETETENSFYFVTDEPLSYDKIFTFIIETSRFSTNTLEEFSLGEEDVFNEMKYHIEEEFQTSYIELPQLIKEKKLVDIKNKIHQISSKFSLLEMEESYEVSKEIDSKIFEDSENQLANCQNLLVDIAVVINQI